MNSVGIQTIHIVEDEPTVLRSLVRVLATTGHAVRGYTSSEEFLAQYSSDTAGCIVMDLCLPGMTGLELQQHLLARQCTQPIVFVTGKADVSSSVRAMRAGAVNFLTKPVEAEALIDSVHEALRNAEIRLREHTAMVLIRRRAQTLSRRERQVFERVVSGRLNKQIAAELGVGEKTVKVHRARVMSKMCAQSLAHLVRMADQIGFEPAGIDERGTEVGRASRQDVSLPS
jgi:FixJ family two-component response regulator